tara:strand:+ start:2479 stop:2940 length:462 start_codon:yes stop_codon:yes gene_type:complete
MTIPSSTPELTAHLGFWLRTVSNHVSHAFAGKLAAKGVTVAEWVMMRALFEKEPLPPSQLAKDMSMTRGAISKLADRLIAKSLLVRTAGRDDGRTQTLALTDLGADLVPQLAALADQNDAAFFDHLSQGERQMLEQILKRIVERSEMTALPTK